MKSFFLKKISGLPFTILGILLLYLGLSAEFFDWWGPVIVFILAALFVFVGISRLVKPTKTIFKISPERLISWERYIVYTITVIAIYFLLFGVWL